MKPLLAPALLLALTAASPAAAQPEPGPDFPGRMLALMVEAGEGFQGVRAGWRGGPTDFHLVRRPCTLSRPAQGEPFLSCPLSAPYAEWQPIITRFFSGLREGAWTDRAHRGMGREYMRTWVHRERGVCVHLTDDDGEAVLQFTRTRRPFPIPGQC